MLWEADQAMDGYQWSRDSSCVGLNHKIQETLRAGASPQLLGLEWLMWKDDNMSPVALGAQGWVVWGDYCCFQPFPPHCPQPEGCWQLPEQVLPHAQGGPAQVPSLASQGLCHLLKSPVEVPHVVNHPSCARCMCHNACGWCKATAHLCHLFCALREGKRILDPLPCFASAEPPELEWGWLINMIHCCLLAVKAGVKLLVPAGLALLTRGLMHFALGNGDTQHHTLALPHE